MGEAAPFRRETAAAGSFVISTRPGRPRKRRGQRNSWWPAPATKAAPQVLDTECCKPLAADRPLGTIVAHDARRW